jgi:hypothetical protein
MERKPNSRRFWRLNTIQAKHQDPEDLDAIRAARMYQTKPTR